MSNIEKICNDNIRNKKIKECQELTNDQKHNHENTNHCHICKKVFITDKEHINYHKLKKVIDHDHYTGKYRGAAHSVCNLRYTGNNDITVGIRNGSNYDFKLLLKQFASSFLEVISVIAESIEKYMTFSLTFAKTEIDTGKLDKRGKKN